MLLSIGIIMKNEEKHLRSCLEGLKPILEQVDSELIIADTGSTDSSVEIAKEYTDNVFHFEWCDDFSAARNSTLKRAKGKWYMFIDADESFSNPEVLIEFFNSGEYRKYKSGTYIQRNYKTFDKSTYSDFYAVRMAEITEKSKFIKPIHEMIVPVDMPRVNLNLIADHFGYVFESDEKAKKKAYRNIDILLKEYEENPDDALLHSQLAESYHMAGEEDKAKEFFIKGIEIAKKSDMGVFCTLSADMAAIYQDENEYLKAIDVIDNYFAAKKKKLAIDIEMYAREVQCYYNLGEYMKSVIAFDMYDLVYDLNEKGYLETVEKQYHSISFVSENEYKSIVYTAIAGCMKINDYKRAHKYLEKIPFDYKNYSDDVEQRLNLEFDFMRKTDNYALLVTMFNNVEDDKINKAFQRRINAEYLKQDESSYKMLSTLAGGGMKSCAYRKYIELQNLEHCGEDVSDKLSEFVKIEFSCSDGYSDFLYFAFKYGISLTDISGHIDIDYIPVAVNTVINKFDSAKADMYSYIEANISPDGIKNKGLVFAMLRTLLERANVIDKDRIYDWLKLYKRISDDYLHAIYNDDVFLDENIDVMPKNIICGYYISRAYEYLEKKETTKYLHELNLAINKYPPFTDLCSVLRDDVASKMEKVKKIDNEIDTLAIKIKTAVRQFMDARQLDNALKILQQYEKINPSDSDIESMKRQIEMIRQNV